MNNFKFKIERSLWLKIDKSEGEYSRRISEQLILHIIPLLAMKYFKRTRESGNLITYHETGWFSTNTTKS